jgi:cold shock CspA family protein
MEIPLQIAFHRLEKPTWAENEIRDRVDKLTRMHDRITGCRVTVDQRAGVSDGSIPPVVRIEISLPGTAPLVVAYEPDRLQKRYQVPELGNAINDAFRLAERQLSEFKEHRTGRTKEPRHDAQRQFLGQVAEMHAQEDHGFLMTKEGGLLYFHRNAVLNGEFDELTRGDEVHYVEEVGDTGPLAVKVRTAARRH